MMRGKMKDYRVTMREITTLTLTFSASNKQEAISKCKKQMHDYGAMGWTSSGITYSVKPAEEGAKE